MLKKLAGVLYAMLFLAVGFLAGQVWDSVFYGGVTGLVVDGPSDFLEDSKIEVYSDRVVIEVENATVSSYEDTRSMLPTLGYGVNGISVRPNSDRDIEVGDIVTYRRDGKLVVHRVVQKGLDEEGVYFVTRGDNSPADDGKVRFGEIERVLVGLVY